MFRAEASRRKIARILGSAYAGGLISEQTFTYRLDQLLKRRVIDPRRLVGDLSLRASRAGRLARVEVAFANAVARVRSVLVPRHDETDELLALDWNGGDSELWLGRLDSCDVVVEDLSVSRLHARLVYRAGAWILQDLDSTNGTIVNGRRVGRCVLRPGDRVRLGEHAIRVD